MKIFILFAVAACVFAAEEEVKKTKDDTTSKVEPTKDKRQTYGEQILPAHLVYRARKQEKVAPVQESLEEDDKVQTATNRVASEEYRPGQVFSLGPQELIDLQQDRKVTSSNQRLQNLYDDETEHRQNLQQLQQMYSPQQQYFYEPVADRQVSLHPSHTVIARPGSSSNGGEASVGAALSVSDTGSASSETIDHELLSLLGQPIRQEPVRAQPIRQEPVRPEPIRQEYVSPAPVQTVAPQNIAAQYQQVDRYITKPTKKPTKLRSKINPPQPSAAPQQYLIETTNVAQQQPQPQIQQYQQIQQIQQIPQHYRLAPQPRPAGLRYVAVQPQQYQQQVYERPETQGLKIVAAPKLEQQQPQPLPQQPQPRPQLAYRLVPQYQQEASPKQYRVLDPRPQPMRLEKPRLLSPSNERPVAYVRPYPDVEKMRSVKILNPPTVEINNQRHPQYVGEQYYLRPLYRGNEQPQRYEAQQPANLDYAGDGSKPPHSSIFVNRNIAPSPKKLVPQMQMVVIEQPAEVSAQTVRLEQHNKQEPISVEHQSIEEQRARLPPPKNNKAYTPQEFAALVAAGYSVTPIPVSSVNPQTLQSRTGSESAPVPAKRRLLGSRRHQFLPLRSDEAP